MNFTTYSIRPENSSFNHFKLSIMQDYNNNANQCISSPALAINNAGSATVKYSTFTFKAGGRVSPSVTGATAPSLATATLKSPTVNGTAVIAPNLAAGYGRIYTLVGVLPYNATATVTPTFAWRASSDFVATADIVNVGNAPMPGADNHTAIGFVAVVNNTTADFVANSTALDATNIVVTYINNYAISGL